MLFAVYVIKNKRCWQKQLIICHIKFEHKLFELFEPLTEPRIAKYRGGCGGGGLEPRMKFKFAPIDDNLAWFGVQCFKDQKINF